MPEPNEVMPDPIVDGGGEAEGRAGRAVPPMPPEPPRPPGQGFVEAAAEQARQWERVILEEAVQAADWQPVVGLNRANIFDPFVRAPQQNEPGLRGEELFKLILSGIKEIYEVDAIIAGGAVRDLAVEATDYKDVDVFIPMGWKEFQQEMGQLGWQQNPKKIATKNYNGKTKKLPVSERAQGRVQGLTVDLVFLKEPLTPALVDNFPIDAQKCIWSLEEGLVVSPLARKDIDNKRFTISDKITDKELLKTLIDKIAGWQKREVYKKWTIVEPNIKEWWELKAEVKTEKKENNLTRQLKMYKEIFGG